MSICTVWNSSSVLHIAWSPFHPGPSMTWTGKSSSLVLFKDWCSLLPFELTANLVEWNKGRSISYRQDRRPSIFRCTWCAIENILGNIFFDTAGTMIFVIKIHHSLKISCSSENQSTNVLVVQRCVYPLCVERTTDFFFSLQPGVFEISYLWAQKIRIWFIM